MRYPDDMKPWIFFLALLFSIARAADMPTGTDTPEGVACDAVNAYIRSDSKAWLATLVKPIYGEEKDKEYEKFKKDMVALKDKNKADKSFKAPKLLKCYKARDFSKNGPGSMAFALFEFTGNKFVDLVIELEEGKPTKVRYHVLQDKDGKWRFEPRPDLCEMLAMGLNEEKDSTELL